MNAKYEITGIAHEKYPFLHRIRALRDIGSEIKAGDLGGFVESEGNLSFEAEDDAWIFNDAIAAGEGHVDKGSVLRERAIVCGCAYASHGTEMSGDSRAEDDAYIRGARLSQCARVSGNGMVLQSPTTKAAPILTGSCSVYGKVMGDVMLSRFYTICWRGQLTPKKNGFHLGYGWCGGPCRWGTKLKTRSLDGVALDAKVHYVGIALDEPERLERLEAPKCSPLAEAGMTEADCLAFCYERGFFWEENGVRLYDILDRVSCWCCKNKNRKELKNIYQFLPQYWEKLKGLQAQIPMPMKPYSRKGVPYGNVFDLEKVFEQEIQVENSGSSPKGKRRRHEQSR